MTMSDYVLAVKIGGTRNGEDWPRRGEAPPADLTDQERDDMLANGQLVEANSFAGQKLAQENARARLAEAENAGIEAANASARARQAEEAGKRAEAAATKAREAAEAAVPKDVAAETAVVPVAQTAALPSPAAKVAAKATAAK